MKSLVMAARTLARAFAVCLAMLAGLGASIAWAVDLERVGAFDIPAQALPSALLQLSRQANVQIVTATKDLQDYQSEPVSGRLSLKDAIVRLLSKTELAYRVSGANSIIVGRSESLKSMSGADIPVEQLAGGGVRLAQAQSAGPSDMNEPVAGEEGKRRPGREPGASEAQKIEKIEVTGTHIRGSSPSSPVITIDQTDIERSGYLSTGDIVRSLPQSFGGGMNPTVIQAGGSTQNQNQYSGASSVNLRGLGSDSTLTLVNGHRLAYSDNLSSVDVSLIPLSAIDRIEILTDGASAIYGSDAVAGVANFILKKSYDGVQTSASFGDPTEGGGGKLQQYDALAGKRWSSGNAMLSYEYSRQNPILARDRPYVEATISKMSLLPKTERNSVFASVDQALGSNLSVFAQGLYTKRASDQTTDLGSVAPIVAFTSANVKQYGTVVGGDLELSNDWHFSLAGNFAGNTANDPQTIFLNGSLLRALAQEFRSRLNQGELSADGQIFQIPSGPILLALGGSKRRETFAMDQHFVSGASVTNISANREVTSAYGELNVPIVMRSNMRVGLNALSLIVAGRHDDYSDLGSSTTPKIGLAYKPVEGFQAKGSWSKSFRAPALFQEFQAQSANLGLVADSLSPSGRSVVLSRAGGNKGLQPEKSTTTTLNTTYSPPWLMNARIDATYYRIRYLDRIVIPIQGGSLTNPINTPFVVRNPTPAQVAAALAGVTFNNNTGLPFDPSTVAAIVDNRWTNAAAQHASGIDLLASYRIASPWGDWDLSLNGAYLDLTQKFSSATPNQQLSGMVFYPPKLRFRSGVSWENTGWTSSAFVNYVGHMRNPGATPAESISSWTTVDAQIGYRFHQDGLVKRARVMLSVQNLFDRSPPFLSATATLVPGLHYDSTNASPIGRFVSIQIVKDW